MHELAEKNKYMGLLFMKIDPEYFKLGREGIHQVSEGHARDLAKYAKMLTHVVSGGLDARYDQVTIIEADSLEQIHDAANEFRMGAKAAYISIIDTVIGVKAPPRGLANRAAGGPTAE